MTDTEPTNADRVEAVEAILIERGIVEPGAVDAIVEAYADDVGPLLGAKVVARAWTDPDYKAALLADATNTIDELHGGVAQTEHVVVVENTPEVHNVVVCTLCSCYPWALLGLPPAWYKDPAYRSRAVREPRALLSEMGLDVDDDVEIRVWDSSAEIRYLVLPERPDGSDDLDIDQLAELVDRDTMIGVAIP